MVLSNLGLGRLRHRLHTQRDRDAYVFLKGSALFLALVVGRIMNPQRCPCLTLEYVTLQSRRGFADVIKLKDPEMGDYPGFSLWASWHHEHPYESGGRVRLSGSRCDDRGKRSEFVGNEPHTKECQWPASGSRKGKGTDFPKKEPEGTSPADTWTSAQ